MNYVDQSHICIIDLLINMVKIIFNYRFQSVYISFNKYTITLLVKNWSVLWIYK